MSTPPPASGLRLAWSELPGPVRAAIEDWLGEPIAEATTQAGGFSPGVAARLRTAGGRRVFVKAVGPEPNPDSAKIHRREITIAGALPTTAPVPRLLWSLELDGWVALVYEDIAGQQPRQPWRADEFERVVAALLDLSAALTPSPLPLAIAGRVADGGLFRTPWWALLRDAPPAGLDDWSARHAAALHCRGTRAIIQDRP